MRTMLGFQASPTDATTKPSARSPIAMGAVLVIGFALTGCMSPEEQRRYDLNQDAGTCADIGARYGSPSHTECMLRQQERRDHEQLLNAERGRISAETARNNLEMLEIMRERRRHD